MEYSCSSCLCKLSTLTQKLCDKCRDMYMADKILQFLTYSLAYYEYGVSIVDDQEFDLLCEDILNEWDTIESKFKDRINEGMLRCTSTFTMKNYPIHAHSLRYRLCYDKGLALHGGKI